MATLLTGAGYIGATLLQRLDAAAAPVVALDNCYSTPREAIEACLPSGTRLIVGDIAESRDVARAFDALGRVESPRVFHLAAQPSAAMAVREPTTTERSNLVGARMLLEAAHERGATVVLGGSFRVYGDDLSGMRVDESTPYGRVGDLSHLSKMYVEQLARMIGVQTASVRLGVTYGLSPIMKTEPAFMTVPNLFCQRAARGDVLRVLEDRPMAFIHVEDAADALLAAACQSSTPFEVYNAAPEVLTIGEVARSVQRLMHDRGASAHIEGAVASEAGFEAMSRLHWQPHHTLQTSLGQVLDYFRGQR